MALTPLPALQLTHLECMWLLRRLRADREGMHAALIALEERLHSAINGELVQAHRILQTEESIADGVIAKLWNTCGTVT